MGASTACKKLPIAAVASARRVGSFGETLPGKTGMRVDYKSSHAMGTLSCPGRNSLSNNMLTFYATRGRERAEGVLGVSLGQRIGYGGRNDRSPPESANIFCRARAAWLVGPRVLFR